MAGATCDSADIFHEETPYKLPLDLECGNRLTILNRRAYTSSTLSAGLKRVSALKTYCL